MVAARKNDGTPVSEIPSRRPSFDLVEDRRQPIRAERDDVHSADQPAQCPNGSRVILQPVLSLRDGCFAGDEPRGDRTKGPHGPFVIDIAPVDGGLKRSGVDDDGSSRRDDGGLFHEATCGRGVA